MYLYLSIFGKDKICLGFYPKKTLVKDFGTIN